MVYIVTHLPTGEQFTLVTDKGNADIVRQLFKLIEGDERLTEPVLNWQIVMKQ